MNAIAGLTCCCIQVIFLFSPPHLPALPCCTLPCLVVNPLVEDYVRFGSQNLSVPFGKLTDSGFQTWHNILEFAPHEYMSVTWFGFNGQIRQFQSNHWALSAHSSHQEICNLVLENPAELISMLPGSKLPSSMSSCIVLSGVPLFIEDLVFKLSIWCN